LLAVGVNLVHDLDGLVTAFMDALNVLPPEIEDHQNPENSRKTIRGHVNRMAGIPRGVFYESCQILSC